MRPNEAIYALDKFFEDRGLAHSLDDAKVPPGKGYHVDLVCIHLAALNGTDGFPNVVEGALGMLTRPTAYRVLEVMTRAGLIAKDPITSSRLKRNATLTDEGWLRVGELKTAWTEAQAHGVKTARTKGTN